MKNNNNSVDCLTAENLYLNFFNYVQKTVKLHRDLATIDDRDVQIDSVNLSARQASRSICCREISAAKRPSSITDASAPVPRNGNNRFEKGSPCVAFPAILANTHVTTVHMLHMCWTLHRLTVTVIRN